MEFDQNKEILEHIEYLFQSGFWNTRWGTKTLIDHLTSSKLCAQQIGQKRISRRLISFSLRNRKI